MMQVTEDHGCSLLPWEDAKCSEIGTDFKIAKAFFPIRELEATQRLHLHVKRQQIIAAMRAAFEGLIYEVMRGHALADEAAKYIGEDHEHGINFFPRDFGFKRLNIHGGWF